MEANKELPQLIIGLDDLDERANYIHIMDVKDDTKYYCPCCKGLIKPRAYKKDGKYQVQPHFYHETGGCNEETYVHYICKTWLLKRGTHFIVQNTKYEVDSIEIEKTLDTSYGNYRPDIIVTTSSGKVFFFEIKTTNKKNDNYIPKWDELGNDVIEVDTRYFINQKYNNIIPKFNLIYSDGECFIKNYSRSDYQNTIAKRKLEWKRQDKLNYKMQWERLDWFWNKLCEYKNKKCGVPDVTESFLAMDYDDKIWCYENISGKTCVEFKQEFQDIINKYFFNQVDMSLKDYPYIEVISQHMSPRIWEIKCTVYQEYCGYKMHSSISGRFRLKKGILIFDENALSLLSRAKELKKSLQSKLTEIEKLSKIDFIGSVLPQSHYASETYNLNDVYFDVKFVSHIHNNYITEYIGTETCFTYDRMSYSCFKEKYKKVKSYALEKLDDEFVKCAASHNINYIKEVENLSRICEETGFLEIRHEDNYKWVALINRDKYTHIANFEITTDSNLTTLSNDLRDCFISAINKEKDIYIRENIIIGYLDKYAALINSCKNKMWSANVDKNNLLLQIKFTVNDSDYYGHVSESCKFSIDDNEESVKKKILKDMNLLLAHYKYESYNYRIMEVRN